MQQSDQVGPPTWERFGAAPPAEPHNGALPYPDALSAWGDPTLLARWDEARREVAATRKPLIAARGAGGVTTPPALRASGQISLFDKLSDRYTAAQAAETSAWQAAEADFKQRWWAGEVIAYGRRGGERTPILSSKRERLDLWSKAPRARFIKDGCPDIEDVRFYRVAEHPHLAALAVNGPAAPEGAPEPQSSSPQRGAYRGPRLRKPRPGPKGGDETSVKRLAWEIAQEILDDDARRPPPGYGRRIAFARLVNAELARQGHQYQDDSVRRMGLAVREWEAKNPWK